jgi:hypothetical protein
VGTGSASSSQRRAIRDGALVGVEERERQRSGGSVWGSLRSRMGGISREKPRGALNRRGRALPNVAIMDRRASAASADVREGTKRGAV